MKNKLEIQLEILNVLKYFEIFKFPLTINEIHKFIRVKVEFIMLEKQLGILVYKQTIFQIKDCYLLKNMPHWIERKRIGLAFAQKRMKRAKLIGGFIYLFPFVRMVAISGSLSKGYADKKTDIDFFIMTSENQLWTARSLLHTFKKLTFLFNIHHSFCMNYFIAEEHLVLQEQNYFTAIELATLIPLNGEKNWRTLISQNPWLFSFLPNYSIKLDYSTNERNYWFKSIGEILFKSYALNIRLMHYTDKKWRKKWAHKGFSEEEYDLAFRTRLYESKNHPANTQKMVLNKIQK